MNSTENEHKNSNAYSFPGDQKNAGDETVVNDKPYSKDVTEKAKLKGKERREAWKAQKLKMKEEKKAKKAAKKAKKREKRERYMYAPFFIRWWHRWIWKTLLILLVLVLVLPTSLVIFLQTDTGIDLILKYRNEVANKAVAESKILKLSPKDKDGEKKIQEAAAKEESTGDTWTICVYMVGSNLEDWNENDLSDMTKALTQSKKDENELGAESKAQVLLESFHQELLEENMDLPDYLYEKQRPVASSSTSATASSSVTTEREGAASSDISEMTSEKWSDKVRIVIQTGGATRWSNSLVNPNKTQRFLYENGTFKEIANMSLKDSCDPDTLAGFMKYCDKNYKSDHNMLVLWDHGGGAFGYGSDSIFGSGMTLKDLNTALSEVTDANPQDPLYDIIGFDACLMSSVEVSHNLYGYAKYMAASCELEQGDGWDYSAWLKKLSDNPSMTDAELCQTIADSYTSYYMTQNVNLSWLFGESVATFSILDMNECENLYENYCQLNKDLLLDAVEDTAVLSKIGQAATESVRYAENHYRVYNTIDLGTYLDNLEQYYPAKCKTAKESLEKAVLYHRQNGYLSESQGISVYFPVDVDGVYGLRYMLDYIKNISDDESTNALYYYKIGGCLNDELQDYVTQIGGAKAKVLNTEALQGFDDLTPTLEKETYSITMTNEMTDMVQNSEMILSSYDKEEEKATSYGSLRCVNKDGNTLTPQFDGKWITLDGEPLYAEIISSSDKVVNYRSRVEYNSEENYLLYTYDVESGKFIIRGIKPIENNSETDADVIGRSASTLKPGDSITPLYEVYDLKKHEEDFEEGEEISFVQSTTIELKNLPKGDYLSSIVVDDPRGDHFYSTVVEMKLSRGKVKKISINKEISGKLN